MTHVGERIERRDAVRKTMGRAVFGSDVALPGMLHGAVVRSPYASAEIVSVDTTRAENAPGVRAVVTGADFPFTFGASIRDQPFLVIDRVRFAGEPVAAVAADTELHAQAAAELIHVEYRELPAVLDARDALAADAPLVHPDLHLYPRGGHEIVPHTNVNTTIHYHHGDLTEGFAEADLVVEDEYTVHAVNHVTTETHVAVALHRPEDGGYTLWTPTDRPFQMRSELASALGLDSGLVRLIVAEVGGSFGGKNTLIAEAVSVALSRRVAGTPVRVEFSREEDLAASRVRMPAHIKLKTGVKADGTLTARSASASKSNGQASCRSASSRTVEASTEDTTSQPASRTSSPGGV